MAIAFRSSQTGFADATPLTITKPTGTAENDFLIAMVIHGASTSTDTLTATGWTKIAYLNNADGSCWLYYKIAGASEGASYEFSHGSSNDMAGSIMAFSGVDTASPLDDWDFAMLTATGTTVSTSVITTGAGKTLVGLAGADGHTTHAWSQAEMTEHFDTQGGSTFMIVAGYSEDVTTATTYNRDFVLDNSRRSWAGLIAINPASTGTAHTVDQTDSTGLTDSATRAWTHKPVYTDPVAISDVAHKERGHTKNETINLTDSISRTYLPGGSTDAMGITDEITIQISKGITTTDAVGVTDSITYVYGKGFADAVGITDEISMVKTMERVFEETFSLQESFSQVLPGAAVYTDNVNITDSVTVQLVLNTLKPDSLSIVDDRRIVVQQFFSMTDDEVRVMTIGDLAYQYWSYLSQLSPTERQSLYDHFKTYAPDGKHWIEDITEQP